MGWIAVSNHRNASHKRSEMSCEMVIVSSRFLSQHNSTHLLHYLYPSTQGQQKNTPSKVLCFISKETQYLQKCPSLPKLNSHFSGIVSPFSGGWGSKHTFESSLTILPLTVASKESTSSAVTPMRLW